MPAWLDNLIPIKAPRLDHRQLAGWEPTHPAAQGLGCRLLADQRIPMADGVTLSGDLYLPRKPGRYPVIVQFAAYTRELHTAGMPTGSNEIGCPPVFTNRGYAQLVLMRRGMGRSGGEQQGFLSDADVDDHEACIAWAAAQPWCDGRVVLFGTSYYGMTQPLVAVRRPPALKAFFCNEICTDYYRHLARFGGTPNLYFFSLWMGANFTEAMVRLRVPPVLRAALSHLTNSRLQPLWQKLLMRRVDALYRAFMQKTPIASVRRQYVNWLVDATTRAACSLPDGPSRKLGDIEIPFVVVQNLGYFNLHQFGCYDLFENAGTPADRKWMILAAPHYGLPVYDWQLEALAFFDHVLFGAENGYAAQPPVRYWLDGADRWAGATAFPPPEARKLRLFLASGGADAATHALCPVAPSSGGNAWAAVPIGVPQLGGLEDVMNQVLRWEFTAPEPLHLAGAVTLALRFACNEIDSQVVARLSRVDTAGRAHLLSMGTIRSARRRIDAAAGSACEIAIDTDTPDPLTPGVPVDLRFSLTPGPTLVQQGERLRLDVASRTDLLKSDVGQGYVHFDLPVPPYFSRNTVLYGPETWLELDMLPG
ncbi:MAG: acyl esterase [Rhodospirillales bacterium 69-11]|nr:CocE/NonD family hydrolase [Rhodospirillales bacterium]OJW27470.1 MAG: acyl esterase [Rhodospirillales bacterium 69-11]